MATTFPVLTHTAKAGKEMRWEVSVQADAEGKGVISTRYGYVGGVVQQGEKTVSEGKNLGKKNATTPFQQAVVEARALWNKKVSAGYKELASGTGTAVPTATDAVDGGAGTAGTPVVNASSVAESVSKDRSAIIDVQIPLPMLAEKFQQRGHVIAFPCFIQPKFDGTRTVGICGLESDTCLYSRNRKVYPHLEHIKAVLKKLPKGLILDGELYTREIHFQKIVGLVKKKTLTKDDLANHALIQLHIYDIVDLTKTFEERFAILQDLFKKGFEGAGTVLHLCVTEELKSAEGLQAKHDEYVAQGYEGIMLRNKAGKYAVGHRSSDLQKFKKFLDDEYNIVGFFEGEGREAGAVIWECETADGKRFRCRPEGTLGERQELFRNGGKAIGKELSVRYQELTEDKIPRFPIGLAIRDYE